MKKLVVVLGLVGALILSGVYVYAHGPGSGPGPRGKGSEDCWGYGGSASFTPEQNEKFRELRQKHIEETAQLRGSIVTKRLELQSLWANPKTDPKVIVEKEKDLRDLQNQMRDRMVQEKLEARKILTPEQLSEIGTGRGMGPGFGGGHMRGYGPGMGGYGHGHGMGYGYGHGMGGYGHGRGPGSGFCN